MDSDRVPLTPEEAIARLPDGPRIHTIRDSIPGIRLGASWAREVVIEHLRRFPVEESGPMATEDNHGICVTDERGILFVETRKAGSQ